MTLIELLNSPAVIAGAALFIGLAANAIALLTNHREEERNKAEYLLSKLEFEVRSQQHKENLHIAIVKLTNKELLSFDELQNIDN